MLWDCHYKLKQILCIRSLSYSDENKRFIQTFVLNQFNLSYHGNSQF